MRHYQIILVLRDEAEERAAKLRNGPDPEEPYEPFTTTELLEEITRELPPMGLRVMQSAVTVIDYEGFKGSRAVPEIKRFSIGVPVKFNNDGEAIEESIIAHLVELSGGPTLGLWREVFAGHAEIEAFLRGVQAGSQMTGGPYLSLSSIDQNIVQTEREG